VTVPYHPARPHSWWTVDEKVLGLTGGPTLFYRLGPRQPIRDEQGRWRRDPQGRTALEAFGALPLGEMYRRLRDGDEAWRASDEATRAAIVEVDPDREPRRWLAAFAELGAFVEMFGPLGFDWARTHEVRNRDADRALDELDRRRMTDVLGSRGRAAKPGSVGRRSREWQVVFRGPGFTMPEVRQVRTFRDHSWIDRVRLGDERLPNDFLGLEPSGPLWLHQDHLRRVLDLVKVLSADRPGLRELKEAVGRLPGIGVYDVTESGVRDPIDLDWREAMRPPRVPREGWWAPFKEYPGKVDWTAAGRLALAQYLSGQLAWTAIGAGLDAEGRVRTRWTVDSLLDVIYLQLLEHVEERLEFGVGWCPRCGGPILRTRQSERTQNRAHPGCAAVLRKRRQRERARQVSAASGGQS
jgi:hypothetical protein